VKITAQATKIAETPTDVQKTDPSLPFACGSSPARRPESESRTEPGEAADEGEVGSASAGVVRSVLRSLDMGAPYSRSAIRQ
jgi:hypothetical protein